MTLPHDRIALVTGSGSGIGRATARLLVEDGWRVVFSGRRVAALQDSIALCGNPFNDIQSRALAVPADVTRPDAVAALFDVVTARFGRLDLLFNSAGVHMPAMPLEALPYDQWRAVVDTNLTGTFLCMQEAFRIMKMQSPQGGRIINKGSISAHAPRHQAVACTATQHALTGLTKACALEGRAFDIAVGQIDVDIDIDDIDSDIDSAVGASMASGGMPLADDSQRTGARTDVQHAARAVLHMASLPLQINMLFTTVMATQRV